VDAAIRQRRRLVATLFHDLSTPLLVLEFASDSDDAELVAEARVMLTQMRALVAAAQGEVTLRPVSMAQAARDVAHLFRSRLAAKGVSLELDCPPDVAVRCDEALRRDLILTNLVSNAIKFSPQGSAIELAAGPVDSGEVLVVRDRGPGLPPAVQAALDQGQVAPSAVGTAGEIGSGYGLLLCREYAESMGGRLSLHPRQGGGLEAKVLLPQVPSPPEHLVALLCRAR
jgi:signal transduction histidine kinase